MPAGRDMDNVVKPSHRLHNTETTRIMTTRNGFVDVCRGQLPPVLAGPPKEKGSGL